ncbi:hypothetical protein GCM10029964_054040 [Kibdelosporangium lantanae]
MAELDPNLSDLADLVARSRHDLLEAAERDRLFKDRRDAGRALAKLLDTYWDRDDVVVLGVPPAGSPSPTRWPTPWVSSWTS